jgi:hypothetical protein
MRLATTLLFATTVDHPKYKQVLHLASGCEIFLLAPISISRNVVRSQNAVCLHWSRSSLSRRARSAREKRQRVNEDEERHFVEQAERFQLALEDGEVVEEGGVKRNGAKKRAAAEPRKSQKEPESWTTKAESSGCGN